MYRTLHSDLDRLFTSVFDTPTTGASRPARRWAPAMDLVELEDHFVVRADLPGLDEADVAIEVEDRVLTIAGERRPEVDEGRKGVVAMERATGSFRRTLRLPAGVDADAIAATFERGVLEVRIPKPEAAKPRRIAISTGDRPAQIEG
jgi:HSP20 family protein